MNKSLQVYDSCIIGAGFAGFGAAIECARQGLETLLIDQGEGWGGVATLGQHQSICGLYPQTENEPTQTLNTGLSQEMVSYLIKEHSFKIKKIGKVYVLSGNTDDIEEYFRMESLKYKNLCCCFKTKLDFVGVVDHLVDHLRVISKNGTETIACKTMIDASGSAEAIRLSGASYDVAPMSQRQLAAYVIGVKRVKKLEELQKMEIFYHLAKAADAGLIAQHLRFGTWLQGSMEDEGFLRLSVLPSDCGYELNKIKNQAESVLQILKENMNAFKSSKICSYASRVIEREGCRMLGEHMLDDDEILKSKKQREAVAVKAAWPIEFWDQSKGPQFSYLSNDSYYEIPSECLMSKDYQNLFAAGRCISVTSRALASTRVTGTCLALGEAAGKLASAHVKEQKRKTLDKVESIKHD